MSCPRSLVPPRRCRSRQGLEFTLRYYMGLKSVGSQIADVLDLQHLDRERQSRNESG